MNPGNAATGAGDPRALARLHRWGGDKLVREMVAMFVTIVPDRIAEARRALNDGEAAVVERAVHSLSSSCAQLGAVRMQPLAAAGESLAARNELAAVSPLLDQLEQEFTSFVGWLEQNTSHPQETT